MLATTSTKRHFDFDDLLDAAPAPANDNAAPKLRALPEWSMSAKLTADSDDGLYAGLSYDMTTGGVFVATYDAPPVGARVDLALTLPDGSELALGGVVRWIREAALASDGLPAGCGIECKGLPVDAQDAIAALATVREPTLWLAEVG